MIVIIEEDGAFHEDISELFETVNQAVKAYGTSLHPWSVIETEGKSNLCVGYVWNGSGWVEPHQDGFQWIAEEQRFVTHDKYREMLHSATTDDTLQALRKIREGDQEQDWEAWLQALDDYNKAVEETQNQPDYPIKVEYPKYPTKPWEAKQ